MTRALDHRECAESLAAYTLGALGDEESTRVRRHLLQCGQCQADFEALRVAADALPASVPLLDPPPELRTRVMDIVYAEAELLQATGPVVARPPASRRGMRWPKLTLQAWPALAALGVAGAVIAVVVVLATGGPGTRTLEAQLTGPGMASLTLNGTRAQLHVRGLSAPPADHVDEVWVRHGSRPPQPAGTFVGGTAEVQVQRPVRAGDEVLVTVEPGRGTHAPTTPPFLSVHA